MYLAGTFTGQIYFAGNRVHAAGQRIRRGQRRRSGPADLRRADGPEDLPARRQVLARLPQPFTREDEQTDYRWQLSVQQIEFSATIALDPIPDPDLISWPPPACT
jgi:hypothetical protein